MKYPRYCDWLIFHENGENAYIVEDFLKERKLPMSSYEVSFLRKLDGTRDPYDIDPAMPAAEADMLLRRFDRLRVTRYTRSVASSLFLEMLTLRVFQDGKVFAGSAKKLNLALAISFLPVFILGAALYLAFGDADWSFVLAGFYAGAAIGLVLHEAGHAIAGTAYGARVFEAGVMLRFFLPGAYVLMDDRPVRDPLHRAQLYAAGVEMNLLLTGLGLLIATFTQYVSGFFLGVAIQNLLLALLNMLFISGFDGEKILGAMLGRKDIGSVARNAFLNKANRRILWRKGCAGKAATVVSAFVCLIKLSLPVMLLMGGWNLVSWIISRFF